MPLLYGDEARNAKNDEGNVELGLINEMSREDGRSGHAEGEGGGESNREGFFRGRAGELEAKDPLQLASRRFSKQSPTAGATNAFLQQTPILDTNRNNFPTPPGTTSFASSTITLMDNHGIIAATGLPPKRFDRFIRNVRWTFLSVYRRLYILVLLPNIITMIVIGSLNHPGLLREPVTTLATATAANILVSVLIRQELVINALFVIFGHCPQWFPLRIRRLSAKIYHLGGVHSGAGVAATVWFGVTNIGIFSLSPIFASGSMRWVIWVTTGTLDFLLLAIILLSIPGVRRLKHDWWEWSHRFCGWAAVATFWVLLVLLTKVSKRTGTPEPPMWKALVASPIFWMLVVITCCLIAPWLKLRKVPVTAERLSDHVVRLHFSYTTPPLCSAPRLSDKPLREWHAFASIPEDTGEGFSVLVSAAGDWTRRIINNPPTHLWKRGWLARGVLNVAPIFKSLVIVATGSGIGPVLSLLKGKRKPRNVRLIWSTKDPSIHYGESILNDVLATDPNADIINTTIYKRPDLLERAHSMYVDSGAEAVFVISNPKVTRKTIYGLESRGVPAFAPIFDS